MIEHRSRLYVGAVYDPDGVPVEFGAGPTPALARSEAQLGLYMADLEEEIIVMRRSTFESILRKRIDRAQSRGLFAS